MLLRAAVFLICFTSCALAQVMKRDDSLHEQLVPESFKITAAAVTQHHVWHWVATVNYTLKNDSGMNLTMAVLNGSISIGSCTDVLELKGALPKLNAAGRISGSYIPGGTLSQPAFVAAGSRIAGTIVIDFCEAPNPGSPTAPLSLTLLLRRSSEDQFVPYPMTVDATVRRIVS